VATSTTQSARPRSDTVSDGISVDHDDVGGKQVPVRGEQGAKRWGAGLLLPLDEHRHADGRIAAVCPEGGQMRCDARLVVRGAAAVQPAVAFRRLERRRRPLRRVALGLYVVVRIEQHRRCSGWRRMARDDRRRTAFADDADVAETRVRQQLCYRVRATPDLVAAGRVGPHGLDADEILEI
jgi:hypothetical protein